VEERLMDCDGCCELAEKLEEKEHPLCGEGGSADVVAQPRKREVALEIHDLARFTPP
jgi:hypothetical protein